MQPVRAVFEKFTERAIKVTLMAQKEAWKMVAPEVTTEHIVIAILEESERSGLSPSRVRAMLYSLHGITSTSNPQNQPTEIRFAPEVRRVFESLDKHEFAAPEHIFLGILINPTTKGHKLLKRMDVDVRSLMVTIKEELAQSSVNASQSNKKDETMKALCTDLCEAARAGHIDAVFGRDKEVHRVIQIMARRTKNNPILLGDPGVGKTAIAEGLAVAIARGEVPEFLLDKRIMQLDIARLVAGTKERGELEKKMTDLLHEIKEDGNVILMIDEAHMLVAGAGGNQVTNLNFANMLKPALARHDGGLQCIAATTVDEYTKYFETDKALARRFQPVYVDEPGPADTLAILRGVKVTYEAFHKCCYTEDAINAIVALASRYIPNRTFPDKAIDILDEAGSKARGSGGSGDSFVVVDTPQIEQVVQAWTRIPISMLNERERLLGLKPALLERIVGQDHAVEKVVAALLRARCGLPPAANRPMATLLFTGPPGVGKTHLINSLGDAHPDLAVFTLDMSEYSESSSVSKLVGAPPGYLGFEEGGELTNFVRHTPYCVVTFDNIEKAHPSVLNTLLQIAEDGRLTDNRGRVASFANALVVVTTSARDTRALFRPEMINRFDEIVHFDPLSREHVQYVVERFVGQVTERALHNWGLNVVVGQSLMRVILEDAYSSQEGLRPLRAAVAHHVEDAVANHILTAAKGHTLVLDAEASLDRIEVTHSAGCADDVDGGVESVAVSSV
jgi:ATP-dependent Clp protease ATP-binding subunit ClpC